MSDLAFQRSTARASSEPRNGRNVEVDEDLFFPAASASDRMRGDPVLGDAPSTGLDLGERPLPTLPPFPQSGVHALERKLAEQTEQLNLRCSQVAELHDLQTRQTAELEAAHNEIGKLNKAMATLQDTAKRFSNAATDRKMALISSDRKIAELQSRLDAALADVADMSQQMLAMDAAYNDREAVITSAFAEIDLLKAKLDVQAADGDLRAAAVEITKRQHDDEIDRLTWTIEEQARKLETLFVDQGIQFKTRERLARRCEDLANTIGELEAAQFKLAAQAEHTTFLETVLRVERETSEATIKKLTEELERERAGNDRIDLRSATMRQEIAALLSQLMTRRRLSLVPEPSVATDQEARQKTAQQAA